MNREDAEAHWKYTKGILTRSYPDVGDVDNWMEICEYLYVEGMLHGYKHGLQTLEETAK